MATKPADRTSDESAAAEVSKGGRPRDPAVDEVIIKATRRRLVLDGYSKMTLGDVAADAGVTRPTLYRRWPGKFELVVDALDYGFREQRNTYPNLNLDELPPLEALTEAVRRLDPTYFNPDAMILMGNFMGETNRTPGLMAILTEHAVEPRVNLLERTLASLQDRGAVKQGIDKSTIASMCFGSYFAAFLRADTDKAGLAEKVVRAIWPAIAANPG
ncbi:AcrR family transcriptional regulator [Arthrobacter globiformis]|uniref:TetR/AcrR family transcriptional regulator n=1 Tax=Arthrobacter globiformis TaxID=1665 RepID=UPI002783FF7E|nr:TetR/AcrR family transcriptional regulator [Arthrobacter globiformis]MDQ1057404.1 AcrR family transcriptional regulator [Arthrobacter globiformis]